MVTIKDYVKNSGENPFHNPINTNVESFLVTEDFQTIIEKTVKMRYGSLNISPEIILESMETLESAEISYPLLKGVIQEICDDLYLMNGYRYKTLYNTTQLVYAPIENVDAIEEYTDEHTGTDSKIIVKGNETTTLNYGQKTNNSEHKVSPNDSEVYTPENIDTQITGEATDVQISSIREDSDIVTHNTKDTHTAHRHGNIGVTTSQQMLEAERKVAIFSIYDVIAKDIIREISIFIRGFFDEH